MNVKHLNYRLRRLVCPQRVFGCEYLCLCLLLDFSIQRLSVAHP
jgi:hypothetical protein